ncbi:phospholipase D family protein [Amorphus sp. 3PC139-8]|uniref:phospholipase D family protein n=1 Tax=Amorphus sp. 3PC139-8 TaxID=2735676 RepID=UPI00345CFB08
MAVVLPGVGILELIRAANDRVVIAAPYIKSPTLRRLLDAVPETVSECACVTRWLPEDIASGVCDLEILDDIAGARGGRLLVHPHLHAKYYSNGRDSLVGSANLTARGLGWHTPSNVELLIALPVEFGGLAEWEHSLLSSAVQATEELRERIRRQADALKEDEAPRRLPEVEDDTATEAERTLWVPQCPTPDRLWQVYRGRGADTMVSSAFKAAQEDLAALSPPQGLTQDLFTAYVAGILKQMPLLAEIDKLASAGLTDAKAHEFLADRLGSSDHDDDYDRVWRVIKQWLVHFFPEFYRLETGQEVLVKGRELPRR